MRSWSTFQKSLFYGIAGVMAVSLVVVSIWGLSRFFDSPQADNTSTQSDESVGSPNNSDALNSDGTSSATDSGSDEKSRSEDRQTVDPNNPESPGRESGSNKGGKDEQQRQSGPPFQVAGQIQKGPLIFGSRVTIAELTEDLVPNGRVFVTRTTDNLGRFSLPATVNTNYVDIYASGYYFDEISGALSGAPIELRAIVNLAEDASPTVNILTTLQAPRLTQLINDGATYGSAKADSEAAVLGVFGIDPGDIADSKSFFQMSLDGTSDRDSVLLATTAILSQVADSDRTTAAPEQATHMSVLLSVIADDLSTDGLLGDSDILLDLERAASDLPLETVRANLENYFQARGIAISTPLFEEWIDKDNSGVLPQRRTEVEGVSFNELDGQEPYAEVTSNTVTFTSLGPGVNVQVSVSVGATIFKNGAEVDGLFTTVNSSDSVYLKTATRGFGESRRVLLNVGSGTEAWNVTTKPLSFVDVLYTTGRCFPQIAGGFEPATWFAVPIETEADATVRYAGVSLSEEGQGENAPNVTHMYLYADDNGKPGSLLGAGSNLRKNQSDSRYVTSFGDSYSCGMKGVQAFFGAGGVEVDGGERYWLVVRFPSPTLTLISLNEFLPSYTSGSSSADYEPRRKLSSDGVTWEDWTAGGSPSYAWRLPQWFLAE